MMSLLEAISPTARKLLKQKVTTRQRVFSGLAFHPNRLLVRAEGSDDHRLATLAKGVGLLAADVLSGETYLTPLLLRLGAHAIGWLEIIIGPCEDAIQRIHAERDRQNELFAEGKISFTCASRTADPRRKLRALVEQVGEVAEAIDEMGQHYKKVRCAHLAEELVQVAAVCVAWLEALEAPVTKKEAK